MDDIIKTFLNIPFPVYLHSFSALGKYYKSKGNPVFYALAEADIVDIAKYFEDIDFPGIESVDALIRFDDKVLLLTCIDTIDNTPAYSLDVLGFLYNPSTGSFRDLSGMYSKLRSKTVSREDISEDYTWRTIADLAKLVSLFGFTLDFDISAVTLADTEQLSSFEQKELLTEVLSGQNPVGGLSILMNSGFIACHWPELQELNATHHAKEHHPEGNVWEHTLEAFNYLKNNDLILALGLLFHDVGKPRAQSEGGNRFHQHAEIGASMVSRFLRKLGFGNDLVEDVYFLVRQHMLPGLVKNLPTYRIEKVMASPLFPVLLELYRCDLSSTFRGPDGYYDACKRYRDYLKYKKNPYRDREGKISRKGRTRL